MWNNIRRQETKAQLSASITVTYHHSCVSAIKIFGVDISSNICLFLEDMSITINALCAQTVHALLLLRSHGMSLQGRSQDFRSGDSPSPSLLFLPLLPFPSLPSFPLPPPPFPSPFRGAGAHPPLPAIGGLGERCKSSPSGVRGGAPVANAFLRLRNVGCGGSNFASLLCSANGFTIYTKYKYNTYWKKNVKRLGGWSRNPPPLKIKLNRSTALCLLHASIHRLSSGRHRQAHLRIECVHGRASLLRIARDWKQSYVEPFVHDCRAYTWSGRTSYLWLSSCQPLMTILSFKLRTIMLNCLLPAKTERT